MNRMIRYNFLLVTMSAVTFSSCGHRNNGDAWLDGRFHAPRAKDAPVDIFYTDTAPTRPFQPISLIRVKAGDDGSALIHKLRIRAREYGADAVVIQWQRGAVSGGTGVGVGPIGVSHSGGTDVVEALGIVYTDTPITAPPVVIESPAPAPTPASLLVRVPTPGEQLSDLASQYQHGLITATEFRRRKDLILHPSEP